MYKRRNEMRLKYSKRGEIKGKTLKLEWLWYPLLPKNSLSIIAGSGGVGKSSFSLYLADKFVEEGNKVLYIDAEQCSDEINDRFDRWNLKNADEIYFLHSPEDCGVIQHEAPESNEELEQLVIEIKPDVIFIDALTSYYTDIDLTARHKASKFMTQLKRIAARHRTAILLLCHTNKDVDTRLDSVDIIAGSKAITDLARSVIIVKKLDDDGKRLISQLKVNSVKNSVPFIFTLTDTGIEDADFAEDYSPIHEALGLNYDTGVKAERYKKKAIELIKQDVEKKNIIKELLDNGASRTECTRAIKSALEILNCK